MINLEKNGIINLKHNGIPLEGWAWQGRDNPPSVAGILAVISTLLYSKVTVISGVAVTICGGVSIAINRILTLRGVGVAGSR